MSIGEAERELLHAFVRLAACYNALLPEGQLKESALTKLYASCDYAKEALKLRAGNQTRLTAVQADAHPSPEAKAKDEGGNDE